MTTNKIKLGYLNNSKIIFDIGYDQANEVIDLMKEANIMLNKVFKDYSNYTRFVLGTKKKYKLYNQ